MRLEALRSAVLEANLELVRRGLILYTFGNASGIDRQSGLVALASACQSSNSTGETGRGRVATDGS